MSFMQRVKKKHQKMDSLPAGYEAKFVTDLFDKKYIWCTDAEGTWFLAAVPKENNDT